MTNKKHCTECGVEINQKDHGYNDGWCTDCDIKKINEGLRLLTSERWAIVNDKGEYWTNKFGWTESDYDVFTGGEKSIYSLPIGGKWELAYHAI